MFFIVLFIPVCISLSSRSALFSCFLSRLCFWIFFVNFFSVFLSSRSILFYILPPFFLENLSSFFIQFISSFFFCLLFNYSSTSSSSFLFHSVLLIFPCCLQHWFTLYPLYHFTLDLHFTCASCYSCIPHFLQLNITVLTSNPSYPLKDEVLLSHFFHMSIYLREC